MKTYPLHRTVRVTLLSALLALVVCSFVAWESGSAHAMSSQAVSTGTTTFVRIVPNQNGTTSFRPSAITVKSGAAVRITNTTPFGLELRFGSGSFLILAKGASFTLAPLTQSMLVVVCAPHTGALTITVI